MLATRCPACGAYNPACLPTPEAYHCSACGYDGLPRAEDVPEIEALARTVRAIEKSELQLSSFEANTLATAQGVRAAFLMLFAVLLIPVILTTGMVEWASDAAGVPLPGLTLAPALLLLVCGGLSAVFVYRRHRALITACAADPPRAGDEVGRCHVCGAPLVSKPGTVLARCGFCSADNLVSQTTLTRVRRAHVTGVAMVENRLRGRERSSSIATHRAELLVLGTGIVGCAVVGLWANHVLDEVADANRAAWSLVYADVDARVCFGRERGNAVAFGSDRSQGLTETLPAKDLRTGHTRVSPLRGFDVVLGDGSRAKIEKVFAQGGTVWIRAEGSSGPLERPLEGLCIPDYRL